MKLLNLNLTKCIHHGWVSFQLGILEDVKEPTCHWIPAWHFKLQFVGHTYIHTSVADPGFPGRGGVPTYYFAEFLTKTA